MAVDRLVALTTMIALLAVTIGAGAALARDSFPCAPDEPPAIGARVANDRCVEAPVGRNVAKPKPVLHDDAAVAPVITGPITRSRHFIYRLLRPEEPSGETIVLLHGSGGDEASMFKLALRVAPDATLLGVRGRVVQKGVKRWYARLSPTEFDQADIRAEAKAFVAFLKERMAAEKLDLERTIFIGYSNGANLIAAVTLLHPDFVQRAVLLRAMPVLDAAPAADLRRTRFLTVSGQGDRTYAPYAPALEALLRHHGALVESRMIPAGHLLADEDVGLVRDWLKASNALAGGGTRDK